MADKAVSLDSAKNYDVAIVAYSDTLKLIECILERPGMDAVRDRLIGTVRRISFCLACKTFDVLRSSSRIKINSWLTWYRIVCFI